MAGGNMAVMPTATRKPEQENTGFYAGECKCDERYMSTHDSMCRACWEAAAPPAKAAREQGS